ncbi:MAG: site-2 protease family protein [Firmicutes bacterium]|nr:site-2 protease family protein [Bacillota bacterium]
MLIKIIAALAIFCVLVLTHEFGHFIVAKACGVYVEDFSVGMGPRILHYQGKETDYCLRLLPIGGWCKMVGEDEESDNPRAFCRKSVGQRMAVVAAGPLMNFLSAVILFIIIYMMIGTYSTEPLVGTTIEGTPAAQVLQEGDRILSIAGQPIEDWNGIGAAVSALPAGESFDLVVLRDGQEIELEFTPYYDEESAGWKLGIYPAEERQKLGRAIGLGFTQTFYFTKELIVSIVGMFRGTVPVDVGGPVAIVTVIGDATSYGLQSVLLLTAYLCINLGLVNLFPLPALDGSRLVFLAIEGLRGKPIDPKKEGLVHFVGLILLLGLMLLITYHDIVNLAAGKL